MGKKVKVSTHHSDINVYIYTVRLHWLCGIADSSLESKKSEGVNFRSDTGLYFTSEHDELTKGFRRSPIMTRQNTKRADNGP